MLSPSDYTNWIKAKISAQMLETDRVSQIPSSSRRSKISSVPLPPNKSVLGLFGSRLLSTFVGTLITVYKFIPVAGTGVFELSGFLYCFRVFRRSVIESTFLEISDSSTSSSSTSVISGFPSSSSTTDVSGSYFSTIS